MIGFVYGKEKDMGYEVGNLTNFGLRVALTLILLMLCYLPLTRSSDDLTTSNTQSVSVSGVSEVEITTEISPENCFNETCGCPFNPDGPLVRCDFL